jgi:hypothetical protein
MRGYLRLVDAARTRAQTAAGDWTFAKRGSGGAPMDRPMSA